MASGSKWTVRPTCSRCWLRSRAGRRSAAGIRSGDRIVAVDGEDAQGIGLARMVEHMRGDPGTHVKLTVQRPKKSRDAAGTSTDAGAPDDEASITTYDLTREIVHVPSVDERRLAGDLAYVQIKQFQQGTHDELVAAAQRVRGEMAGGSGGAGGAPLRGVLLDLRNNPGGLVDEASAVADEFLEGGVIYTMRHRGQVVEE